MVSRAVVARCTLAEDDKRVERLQLFFELADALEGLVRRGLPDSHGPTPSEDRSVGDLGLGASTSAPDSFVAVNA